MVAESPMGPVVIAFVPSNDHGVLDHDVTLPSGETVHNPMRVIAAGGGSEVVFTLRRAPGMTDEPRNTRPSCSPIGGTSR